MELECVEGAPVCLPSVGSQAPLHTLDILIPVKCTKIYRFEHHTKFYLTKPLKFHTGKGVPILGRGTGTPPHTSSP